MLTEKNRLVEGRRGVGKQLYALTPVQIVLLVVLGVAFWVAAATGVRIGSTFGIFGPIASLISFAAAAPICWLSVLLIIKVAQLRADQIVPGISLGLGVATCCDGIAITWASWLYGSDPAQIALGAAWILWGVFLFTAAAFAEAYRQGYRTN